MCVQTHVVHTQHTQALSRASSFEAVVAAHRAYLHTLQSTCFLLRDRTWRLLDGAVQSLLNMVLAYCQLQRMKMDPVQVCGVYEGCMSRFPHVGGTERCMVQEGVLLCVV